MINSSAELHRNFLMRNIGSGRTFHTIYKMMLFILYKDFMSKVIFVIKNKSFAESEIKKVWEEKFEGLGIKLYNFKNCIDIVHDIKLIPKIDDTIAVYIDHYNSEIERCKREIKKLSFIMENYEKSLYNFGKYI